MRIGLLGGLEVLDDDGRELVVAGAKQRAFLAVLALHAGRVVPTDQLVEALWGEDPPAAVRNGLQGLASKLRRSLGSADLVAMRSGGYVLELPADAVDVHRYERLVAEGQAAAALGERSRAVAVLEEAESVWRGDPLAEFAYDDFAATTISRFTELRLAAIEERLDIDLQLGGHHGAVVELESLVAAHPLRERLRGLLMLALYRAGRQADALRVFQEGRTLLGEELGLEPSPELRRLEGAILAQDPGLDHRTGAAPEAQGTVDRPGIPAPLMPLIGRDAELRDLTALVAAHRLVTLVGPGGVGKTRLAVEVCRVEAALLADGGCLVELAPVGDPAGVRGAVAAALDLPDPGHLAESIGDKDLLVLLDNCEHVIDAAAEVADDLLRRCPGLRLVATSREGLRIGGEKIWPVPPLSTDDAVELFVERARASGAPLELSAGTRVVVAEICSRLDGLPLALELAAARARAFPLEQIADRLQDRFRLLTGGSRTALPRQQTLRAVVDWSYELLFDDEQRVFERLSVFPGGCDLATIEAVCGDEALDGPDLDDIVHALVDKSLVVAEPVGDQLRFHLLQTLAQYGWEKLADRRDGGAVRDVMAAHYAELCGRSAAAFSTDIQRPWLATMARERDNIRAALEWAVATDDADTALTIAGGASWPHWLGGTVTDGLRWLDDAFGCRGDPGDEARMLGLIGRGLLGFLAGAGAQADADLVDALEIAGKLGDVPAQVLAHSFHAEMPAARGDMDEAHLRRLAVLEFHRSLPDEPFVVAGRRYSEAKLATIEGDLTAAEAAYREATAGFAALDRPIMHSMCLGIVADFDERAGNLTAAIECLEAAIRTNDALGLRGFTGALVARLGWVLLQDGRTADAEAAYERALDIARWLGNAPVVLLATSGSAALHRVRGRDDAAVAAAIEALELHLAGGAERFRNRIDPETELRVHAAVCCTVLGVVAAARGGAEQAALLLGHADRLRAEAGLDAPAFQRDDISRATGLGTAELGPQRWAAAFERGRGGRLGHEVPIRPVPSPLPGSSAR